MKIYKLTPEQKGQIHGSFFSICQFFNCVQDINDDWFLILSEGDIDTIRGGEWAYILDFPEGEYTPKPSPLPPLQ